MGKIKAGLIKNCKACDKEFYVPKYRSDTAKFCSLFCQNHKQHDKYVFECKSCGKKCETSPSRRYQNKKFCSLQCREAKVMNEKERRKKIKAINIVSRGHTKARTVRKYISQFKEMKCEFCGYDEYEFCLDMHHLDHNPTNNHPDNIGILCCMCHRKLHKGVIEMPLIKGAKAKTRKGFSSNVKKEMDSGKKQSQAVAIAYSESGEKKKSQKSKGKKK
jgi:hypothetical protein